MKAFALLGLMSVFLFGCTNSQTEVFGVPTDVWKGLTNEQKLEVIKGYNSERRGQKRRKADDGDE